MVVNGTSCSISRWLFTIYDLNYSAPEARENLWRDAAQGSRLCSIIDGLSFLLAYLLHPWETHEEWVVNEPREDFIGTRVPETPKREPNS